mmetsp:Transcript_17974/g.30586  ORF Transcript_17974/g.30586 Transcript_17974/m.30586 type:complete len:275 (-) Transcript_17974:8-832(-)
MSTDIYQAFVETVRPLVKEQKLPTRDLCRVLNILVKISAFDPLSQEGMQDKELVLGFRENYEKFLFELLGRLRHSVFNVPQDYFALTMANLVELEYPQLTHKFLQILKQLLLSGKTITEEFMTQPQPNKYSQYDQLIDLHFALLQIQSVVEEFVEASAEAEADSDSKLGEREEGPKSLATKQRVCILGPRALAFLHEVDLPQLSDDYLRKYMQLLCLAQMLRLQTQKPELLGYNMERIVERLRQMPPAAQARLFPLDPETGEAAGSVEELIAGL